MQVGNYYSTPLYSFKMKCAECPNKFVIETDPKNADYKVISGGKWKNETWDHEEAEGMPQVVFLLTNFWDNGVHLSI